MPDRVFSVELRAKVDGAVAGFRKAKAAVDDLTKAAAPSKADAFTKLSDKAALAGVGIASAMGLAVKRFADFDQSMSAVQANSGATGKELENLRALAVKLGADSQFSAKEAADGINEMAKAGVSAQAIMGGGLKGALDLAAAGQIGVAEAAETAATAMTQFKLNGDAVPHIADLLANAANKAQGGVGDMAQALKQAGLVAASTGLSIEETTGGLTAFASAGLIGSDAGTSFKTMLQRLSAPADDAKAQMDKLGISAYDAQGNFVGLANVAGQLQRGMEDLTPAQRNAALATIFGTDAVRAANVLYEQGADGINRWVDAVNEQGAAAKQAATLTDNLKGDIERLGGALDSVFIQTGGAANSGLRDLVQGMTGFVDRVNQVPGPILLAGGALASFALLAPKGALKWREYKAQLDTLGLSLDKISAKAPRTGAALEKAGGAAKRAGVALVAAAVAAGALDSAFSQDGSGIGVQGLTKDLVGSDDAVKAFSASVEKYAKSQSNWWNTDGVRSYSDVLKAAFDPSIGQKADKIGGAIVGISTDSTNARDRLRELDQVLALLVAAGQGDRAAQMFAQFAAAAKDSGVSADQLKSKLPGYTEALAGVANQSTLTGAATDGMTSNLDKVEASAEDAKKAVDDYLQSMQDAGLVVLDARQANREFEQSLDDVTDRLNERKDLQKQLAEAQKASADTDKNGKVDKDEAKRKADDIAKLKQELADHAKGFDVDTKAGRTNGEMLDAVAKNALDVAKANYEQKAAKGDLEGAEETYRTSLVKSRADLVKTAEQLGMTKKQAEAYADQILKIPPAKATKVTFQTVNLDDLKTAGDYLKGLKDKKVTLTVGTIQVGNTKVNAGQFSAGGYTGDGGKYEPAGIVHRGEYVITKAATTSIGKATLDYLNARGRLPGYASGGYVESSRSVPMMLAAGPSVSSYSEVHDAPIHVEKVYANSWTDLEYEAEQRRRLTSLGRTRRGR